MDSSSLLTTIAAAVGFFTLLGRILFMVYGKFRFHQENKEMDSSSLSPPSSPLSSLSCILTHQVFPSFHGEDVRRDFLSHIQKEFQRKGITTFVDNEIKRGESIGPELIRAIRGSKIAIVLLSRNYASSKWCLDELVEIMMCRKDLGQTVMVIFYKVDPTDVKKQTRDFGKVFRKTCAGKTKEDIGRWRQALGKVATIAGYHSSNWNNEADMIEKITTDISNKLNNSTPSNDFDGLVGMGTHMEKMERFLCLDLDEVRMIGIWGPSGIGKTTIARFLFSKHSHSFDLSVFMENIKASMYTKPACSDDYSLKLHLHQQLMSQIINQEDIEIPHLGVAQERLKDKKVFVVLDDVDRSVQLDAMAKETRWFGPGSRIVITTQDRRLLRAHGIKDIYKVDYPPSAEALQIFCMNAFGQNSPKVGFEELALEATKLAGKLPLGLRVMGSYFRRMSKQDWTEALPRFRTHLDSDIQSILKFSYDALDDKDRDLFLHIACFFRGQHIDQTLEETLGKKFSNMRQGLRVLAEKSLISIDWDSLWMHNLLAQLGREIVRKQSIHEPGQRQFLVDAKEICEVLTDDTCSTSVVGIYLNLHEIEEELYISERAFSVMSNLQFLRFMNCPIHKIVCLQRGLIYISRKLRILHWEYYPMTCLPFKFYPGFLVTLFMPFGKLEKLWEGIQPLRYLRYINLSYSRHLRELPDLSTATDLEDIDLNACISLEQLPSSIGKAINLIKLNLRGCSSLVELPSSIGNVTNLKKLYLNECSSLVELPASIGKLDKLSKLSLERCSKLEALPININLESLDKLDLTNCSMLKSFPEISTNIKVLKLRGTAIKVVPSSIRSWSRLDDLDMPYFENLEEFPHAFDSITELHLMSDTQVKQVAPWVKNLSRLSRLEVRGCRKLVSLPQLPDSLLFLDAENCESLERLGCSFHNPEISLNFGNCFKLNKEARDLIIQAPTCSFVVLPGGEVPAHFTYRAIGGSVTVNLNQRPLHTFSRFKACILLVNRGDSEANDYRPRIGSIRIVKKQNGSVVTCLLEPTLFTFLTENLYIFTVEAEMTSSELVFEFKFHGWEIRECGLLQLLEAPT